MKGVDIRFANLDTNHDGFITKAELDAAEVRTVQQLTAARNQRLREEFTRLDTNKDGKLSFEEFIAAAPPFHPRQSPDQLVQQYDANHDGKISTDEFRAPEIAKFSKFDLNHDGMVTPEEAQKVNGGK
jgi:Ca2+-binding EF-hand superfamily protein